MHLKSFIGPRVENKMENTLSYKYSRMKYCFNQRHTWVEYIFSYSQETNSSSYGQWSLIRDPPLIFFFKKS